MKIDDIFQQKCAEPSDINEHLPVLKDYASRSKLVTEFGVRGVVSTWALIAGRPDRVTSYDLTSPGDEMLCQIRSVAAEVGVAFRFFQANVLKIEIAPTDLLFVDTYHVYTQLIAELNLHAKRVSKWIILHDTETFGEQGEASSEKGLNHALREFLGLNPEWLVVEHFKNNNGLTVIKRQSA